MRTFILLIVASAAYIASAMPADEKVAEKTYSRYIEFPDGDGNIHTIDLEAEPDYSVLDDIARNAADSRYFLYTRGNPRIAQEIHMNDADSLRNSYYNADLPTVVIVHGWVSTRISEPNPTVTRAYLGSYDVNVINVDWSTLSHRDYTTAVAGVPGIGRGVGQFVNFIINTVGGHLDNFHLVGFSLGAHVVGNAGRELGGRVARIMGLDPSGPLWVTNVNRLSSSDGVYVEAIHTDGGPAGLGIGRSLADVDFYPNGGIFQPGCLTSMCNHDRAWELFASSVTHNHLIGYQCTSSLQISMNTCSGSSFPLGNSDLRKTGRGDFRVNTGRSYPF